MACRQRRSRCRAKECRNPRRRRRRKQRVVEASRCGSLISAGSIVRRGLIFWRRALKMIPGDNVRIDIYAIRQSAGPDRDYDWLAAQAQQDRRLRLHPAVAPDRVIGIMAGYDLIAIPSRWLETGPLVALEAFAAGVPVLGANLGGIAELVRRWRGRHSGPPRRCRCLGRHDRKAGRKQEHDRNACAPGSYRPELWTRPQTRWRNSMREFFRASSNDQYHHPMLQRGTNACGNNCERARAGCRQRGDRRQ